MTILVAYAPRPEGQAALLKGIEIAKRRKERLVVINVSSGSGEHDAALAEPMDVERVEQLFKESEVDAVFRQYVRGRTVVEELDGIIESAQVSLVVIGLRKRTAVGKLFLGSVAQEILLSVPCPVLAVKAR